MEIKGITKNWQINSTDKTISPVNTIHPIKGTISYETRKSKYEYFERTKPRIRIFGTLCKDGVLRSSNILDYKDKEVRSFKLLGSNEAIILTD